jgi:hypothetical protein
LQLHLRLLLPSNANACGKCWLWGLAGMARLRPLGPAKPSPIIIFDSYLLSGFFHFDNVYLAAAAASSRANLIIAFFDL